MGKFIIGIYRVAQVQTDQVRGAVGLEQDADNEKTEAALRKKFGPHMAPTFRIFWPNPAGYHSMTVGMEVMSFDIKPCGVPQAGIVNADPIDPMAIARMDGALQSELMRIGVWTRPEDYSWRVFWEEQDGGRRA